VQKRGLHEIHERYRHISLKILISLPEMAGRKILDSLYCKTCEQGKSHKQAAKNYGGIHTTDILERLDTDLIGPIKPESRGSRYLLVITDNYSLYTIAIPIRQKSDAAEKHIHIINALEQITKKIAKNSRPVIDDDNKNEHEEQYQLKKKLLYLVRTKQTMKHQTKNRFKILQNTIEKLQKDGQD
jgi:isopropylmalate/homocitrate/citramalate synthase